MHHPDLISQPRTCGGTNFSSFHVLVSFDHLLVAWFRFHAFVLHPLQHFGWSIVVELDGSPTFSSFPLLGFVERDVLPIRTEMENRIIPEQPKRRPKTGEETYRCEEKDIEIVDVEMSERDLNDQGRGTTSVPWMAVDAEDVEVQMQMHEQDVTPTIRMQCKPRKMGTFVHEGSHQGRKITCMTCDWLAVQHSFHDAPSARFQGMGIPPKRPTNPMQAPRTVEQALSHVEHTIFDPLRPRLGSGLRPTGHLHVRADVSWSFSFLPLCFVFMVLSFLVFSSVFFCILDTGIFRTGVFLVRTSTGGSTLVSCIR